MERYTSCLASLSPCGKCDSKELVFFQLDLYTVGGSFIVNRSPYNTQKYFLLEFCVHKSFSILTLLQLKSRWFCFLHGKKRERVWGNTLAWGWSSVLVSAGSPVAGLRALPLAAAGWAAVSHPGDERKSRTENLRLSSSSVVAKGGKKFNFKVI